MVLGFGAPGVTPLMEAISVIVVIILIASMILPRKLHFFFNGLVLITLGVMPILKNAGTITFDVNKVPIISYMIYFIVVLAGKELIKEGFHGEKGVMRYASITLAIFIITITTIPTLYKTGAISFTLPNFPPMINNVIYIITGVMLIAGVFTLIKEK